nr:unnamed protein product [Callosobruchus analis]
MTYVGTNAWTNLLTSWIARLRPVCRTV